MADSGKEEGKNHPIRWDGADWQRIDEVARLMSREQHLDLGPTDVIRSAVRRFCEDRLGPEVPQDAASSTV